MLSDIPLQIIVVGAGAAGLMAAGVAAQGNAKVTVLDKNDRPARKVMITGKGRCNVTNNCSVDDLIKNVPQNAKFLYSAFRQFTSQDTMNLFESLGVPLKTERGNRVFPVSDKAVDIVDALVKFAKKNGANVKKGHVKELVIENGCCKGVVLASGDVLKADAVIVCTGGCSYPGTGSTGDGYSLAKQAGHTIIEPYPSLVPLCCEDSICQDCQGLSLKNAAISVVDTKTEKEVYHDFGEMLFTHFGVSGPMILSASAHMREKETNRYQIHLDLKPALEPSVLDARIVRDMVQYKNMDLQNAFIHLMPKSLVAPVLALAGVLGDTKCHSLTKEERKSLVDTIKDIVLSIKKPRPISEAVITSGGVNVKEVDPKTMESKCCKNLYFAGEVLDVDAYTGGFNLQIAFSTGFAAGTHVHMEEST